jgi:pimeloyl-ACP methyl ester carboxylesterase
MITGSHALPSRVAAPAVCFSPSSSFCRRAAGIMRRGQRPDYPPLTPNLTLQDVTFRSSALHRDMQYRVVWPLKVAPRRKLQVVYLISEVENKFPVAPGRSNRAIVGISMGGFGAVKLALRHPELLIFAGGISSAIDVPRRTFSIKRLQQSRHYSAIFASSGSPTRPNNDPLECVASPAVSESWGTHAAEGLTLAGTAENSCRHPSAAKAAIDFVRITARLKATPFQNSAFAAPLEAAPPSKLRADGIFLTAEQECAGCGGRHRRRNQHQSW